MRRVVLRFMFSVRVNRKYQFGRGASHGVLLPVSTILFDSGVAGRLDLMIAYICIIEVIKCRNTFTFFLYSDFII